MSSAHTPVSRNARSLKLAFLVSDSRSGSTFAARNIHEKIQGVIVTPELNLVWAIRLINSGKSDNEDIVEALHKGRVFEALGQTSDGFSGEMIAADFATALRGRIAKFAEATGEIGVEWVVIKKGHHAMQANALCAMFPEAKFICLHRDPRAVYESKRRTDRPYIAGETMAWSGVAGTTWRWRKYTRRLFSIEKNLGGVRVRFEDLSQDLNCALDKVSHTFSSTLQDSAKSAYSIASKEVGIHDGARKKHIDTMEAEKWRLELGTKDVSVIQSLTKSEMRTLGYAPTSTVGPLRNAVFFATESVRSVILLMVRTIRRRGS